MSKFKGTPGPWYRSGKTVYALNEQGFNRFSALVQDAHTGDEELEANARLIASAPELLEALCKTRRTIQALIDDGHMGYVDLRSSIDSTIAKALGEDAT